VSGWLWPVVLLAGSATVAFMIRRRVVKVPLMLVLMTLGTALLLNNVFSSLDNLPTGEFVKQVPSPDGNYTFRIYLVNGGATVAWSTRGEVVQSQGPGSPRTIYWCYRQPGASVDWIDNETVRLNGKITLNVVTDTYDWRTDSGGSSSPDC
jgi:hypothetical protein